MNLTQNDSMKQNYVRKREDEQSLIFPEVFDAAVKNKICHVAKLQILLFQIFIDQCKTHWILISPEVSISTNFAMLVNTKAPNPRTIDAYPGSFTFGFFQFFRNRYFRDS